MCFNHIVERGYSFGKIISWLFSKVGEVGFETFGSGQGSQTSIIIKVMNFLLDYKMC
jgi:hypothetical protein